MKPLDSMPAAGKGGKRKYALPVPQIRVLQVLAESRGPLSRAKISDRCGNKTVVVVGRAVGYSDPEKRAAFEKTKDGWGTPEKPCPSLLTLGYATEYPLDINGLEEVVIEITELGRSFFESLGPIELGPLQD